MSNNIVYGEFKALVRYLPIIGSVPRRYQHLSIYWIPAKGAHAENVLSDVNQQPGKVKFDFGDNPVPKPGLLFKNRKFIEANDPYRRMYILRDLVYNINEKFGEVGWWVHYSSTLDQAQYVVTLQNWMERFEMVPLAEVQ